MHEIPSILTANTYFWRPAGSASGRRANERRRHAEVAAFVTAHETALQAADVTIDFDYSESCRNVYKHCRVTRNGRRSNIMAVRKAIGS